MTTSDAAIDVKRLSFQYGSDPPVLKDVSFSLPRGSRCLLLGDNGAGKTTMLRILGGKHYTDGDQVRVLGRRSDFDAELNNLRSYLGGDWGKRTVAFVGFGVPMTADIPVREMMLPLQQEFPERRDRLYALLDIDPEWRMHKVSDGQRRRVQIMLGLLRPFELLLLDEITTDLDVVTRMDLLAFLKEETEARGVTIVYATHIFDGLDGWPSDVVYLWRGSVRRSGSAAALLDEAVQAGAPGRTLLGAVGHWIRSDRAAHRAQNPEGSAEAVRLTAERRGTKLATYDENPAAPDGTAGGYAPGVLARAERKAWDDRFEKPAKKKVKPGTGARDIGLGRGRFGAYA
jgi:CCR4-NOT complex subunit CAF16